MKTPARTLPGHEQLIDRLVAELAPVRAYRHAWARALAWLAIVLAIAGLLAARTELADVGKRLASAPDMWISVVGAIATAVLGAFATFQLSLPDRKPTWSLLPLPGLMVWIAGSGLGCLRTWLIVDVPLIPSDHIKQCFFFIVGFSLPLSALMLLLLRRSYFLHPSLGAGLAGLSVSAASAALLVLAHPYESTALDLSVHLAAVSIVILANRTVGPTLLRGVATGRRRRSPLSPRP